DVDDDPTRTAAWRDSLGDADVELVRGGGGPIAVQLPCVPSLLVRKHDFAGDDLPGQRVKRESERGDDPEVSTPASHAPEQIRMLGGAGAQQPAVGGGDLDLDQVVDREAETAGHPT